MPITNKGEHILLPYLNKPGIIPNLNPRAGRMKYQNSINNERNFELKFQLKYFITIITRGKGESGRILIGPKDFDAYLDWKFNLETCTEEELIKEFERTFPMAQLPNIEQVVESSYSPPPSFANISALKEAAHKGLREAGLLPKEEKEEDKIDPYSIDPR